MRKKLTIADPQAAFERILDALARELVDVSDEEILAAAKELGMNPLMQGSAAFLGLRVPWLAQYTDFFNSDQYRNVLTTLAQMHADADARRVPTAKSRRPKRSPAAERKH